VLFTTRSDSKGSFSFGSIPKGDYTLHVKAPAYRTAEREIRVTNSDEEKSLPKIDVTLGFRRCEASTHVKGVLINRLTWIPSSVSDDNRRLHSLTSSRGF
jgi:hypothetical protein